jgi:small subunit ribosomal protein S9
VAEAKGKKTYYLGTGRRKTAVARVRISEGSGTISINGRGLEQFFTEDKDRNAIVGPLQVVDMRNRLDVIIDVQGGGITGQAGAACQGIARALKEMFNLTTPPTPAAATDGQAAEGAPAIVTMADKLRHSGYLTRDSRMKERKKYGRKGARKSFQFSKR